MIDLQQRAMTGTTLTLDTTNTKQEKPFDIVEQLLAKNLDDTTEDDVEVEPGKDEQELEEMSAMHEELAHLQGPPELEAVSVLTLPPMTTEGETRSRRPGMIAASW